MKFLVVLKLLRENRFKDQVIAQILIFKLDQIGLLSYKFLAVNEAAGCLSVRPEHGLVFNPHAKTQNSSKL